MMPRNRALTGRAAGGLIPRPCGTGERRVEQDNHEQTDACGNRTAAMLIAEGHVRPNGHSMIRQKAFACSSWLNDNRISVLWPIRNALLRILTWCPSRRRLKSWLTVILSWILARTRKRRSRRATNSTAGSRLFAWTRGCFTNLTVRRAPPAKLVPSPSPSRSRPPPPNPRERRQRVPRQKRRPKQASQLQRNRRQPPTGKWAYWSGSIFLRTKSFPSSAGSIASLRRSLSRALRQKSSITAIPNSHRRTGSSRLLSDLTEAREFWICECEAKLAAKFRAFGLARSTNLK